VKFLPRFFVVLFLSVAAVLPAAENATPAGERKPGDYKHGPDSLPQEGVPKGRLEGPFEWNSQIIRGTVRRYWIYVPAQYTGETPAALLVFHDGQRATNPDANASLRVPQVLENLIHKKEIPVTIGLFVTPGHLSEHYPDNLAMNNPNNRAQEYDVLSDNYTRMLIEELIPEVGKKYKLTDNVDGRVIGGTSSGAICAFTSAWERPDYFRKVISMIGSYTSIGYRAAKGNQPMVPGGDLYPTLIRKSPIKPIRIFLQDGSNDLDNPHGNWFLANQQMLTAFNFANRLADQRKVEGPRYDVKHEWGDGTHSDLHGGTLLPDILRWMFRDYQK
jgi:poly(3-hydroxybutyrate) depolymerase